MRTWSYLGALFLFVIFISGMDFLTPGLKLVLVVGLSVLVFSRIFNEKENKPPEFLDDDLLGERPVSMQRMHVDAPKEHIMNEAIFGGGYHHSLGVPKPEFAGEIQKRLLHQENVPSTREILKHLLTPDLYEALIFIFSIVLTYLIFVPLLRIPLDAYSVLIAYAGIIMIMLYFTRWGYSSVFHLLHEQEKALEKLMQLDQGQEEHPYVLNIKIIGILVSLVFTVIGFYLI